MVKVRKRYIVRDFFLAIRFLENLIQVAALVMTQFRERMQGNRLGSEKDK